MKSSDISLSRSTTRKLKKARAGGRPRMPLRNSAERLLSVHQMMVWLSSAMAGAPRSVEQPLADRRGEIGRTGRVEPGRIDRRDQCVQRLAGRSRLLLKRSPEHRLETDR